MNSSIPLPPSRSTSSLSAYFSFKDLTYPSYFFFFFLPPFLTFLKSYITLIIFSSKSSHHHQISCVCVCVSPPLSNCYLFGWYANIILLNILAHLWTGFLPSSLSSAVTNLWTSQMHGLYASKYAAMKAFYIILASSWWEFIPLYALFGTCFFQRCW